jgi:hypothetical protein
MDYCQIGIICSRLSNVELSEAHGDLGGGGLRAVGRASLAEKVKGGSCTLPMPETEFYGNLQGDQQQQQQMVPLLLPNQVPAAIRKLLGRKESAAFLAHPDGRGAVLALLQRCGLEDPLSDDVIRESFESAMEEAEAEDLETRCFLLSPLSWSKEMMPKRRPEEKEEEEGAEQSPVVVRLRYINHGETGKVLISAYDFLQWIGLDRDGTHREWKQWIFNVVYYARGGTSSANVMRSQVFKGDDRRSTPAICHSTARIIVDACLERGEMSKKDAQKALDVLQRCLAAASPVPTSSDDKRAAEETAVERKVQERLQALLSNILPPLRSLEKVHQQMAKVAEESLVQMQELRRRSARNNNNNHNGRRAAAAADRPGPYAAARPSIRGDQAAC